MSKNFKLEVAPAGATNFDTEANLISTLTTAGASNIVVTDYTWDSVNNIVEANVTLDIDVYNLSLKSIKRAYGLGVSNCSEIILNANELNVIDLILPLTVSDINIANNNITDYSLSENWASNLPIVNFNRYIGFTGNPASPIGTHFEAILATKNVICQYL